MNIAILGYAGQGKSAYAYWNSPSNELTICDQNKNLDIPPDVNTQLGADYLHDLNRFDLLIRTPALHPRDIVEANPDSPGILEKVTSVTNEFMRICPTKNVIGVTGTKGKGTTSTLITHMLEASGHKVHLGGNIGIPPLDLLHDNIQPDDWVVLELANFQLIDLHYSPHIAVCLMISEEHIDWQRDFKEYLKAKQQMFIHQKPDDIAIYYAENSHSREIASASPAVQIPYMAAPGAYLEDNNILINSQIICSLDDIQLLGKHNWQNVAAAATAVWQITQDTDAMQKAVRGFYGLPHRLEYVREVNNVRYFNDSFASVPAATIAALDAIAGSKVVIMGGYDRGLDLTNLAEACQSRKEEIKKVLLIGASAARAAESFAAHGFTNYEVLNDKQLLDIAKRAQEVAENGDSVLLSPGFPSFDMFKNFEERGLRYKEAVNQL